MTLSLGNSSVQLRLAANAVAPVSLTFVGSVMVRATEAQARPHRLQLEEFALFRPGEPATFAFVLSLPSVTDIKAIEAVPVVQITYE